MHVLLPSSDRGRKDRLGSIPPPSEPDGRISRIRLSSWWFTSKRVDGTGIGSAQVQQPLPEGPGCRPATAPRREGRQQTGRSLRRFDPRHVCGGRSGVISPPASGGQSRRFVFRRLDLHVSTFLHPFAPPALPGFDATMSALTPARRFFLSLSGTVNAAWPEQVSLHYVHGRPTIPPPTTLRAP